MSYIDGFVVAVPTANKEAYRAAAAQAWPLFKEFGAIRHIECWGDDFPDGKTTDFKRAKRSRRLDDRRVTLVLSSPRTGYPSGRVPAALGGSEAKFGVGAAA